MRLRAGILAVLALALTAPAYAQRTILADDYLDRLRGMWLGEILGNYAGRATEGWYCRAGGNPASDISFVFDDPWDGDDDTCFEYMYMTLLASDPSPTNGGLRDAWVAHLPLPSFYIANRQARWLMADGLGPPQTGGIHQNVHWYAIDSQITTEALGAAAPGMRQRAADLAGQFGSVTNDGFAVHAAQFYAAMYAAAALESDVESVVAKGLEVVPATSRTHEIIESVRGWHAQDKLDGVLDWRATQVKIYDKYVGADSHGRYRYWIESSVNTAMTTLAILYGEGDFKETVKVGVLAGFDSDCNPATAGGLVGLMTGYSGLPTELTSQAVDDYVVSGLQAIQTNTTITGVAASWQAVTEAQILAAGGSITGTGAARTYHLPAADPVAPPPEKPDRTKARGLVGAVRSLGGSVTVSASIETHDPAADRDDLDRVADGISDVSYNGHLPYWTRDDTPAQPAGGDYYQLDFDRDVTFSSVVFHEGDILWATINSNPKDRTPKGGYFLDLTVEVGDHGVFTEVTHLATSEPLDTYTYFQHVRLSFDPITGDAVRIRGTAGGTEEFTSIVELEAFGTIPGLVAGDANNDGRVDVFDLGLLANHYGSADAGLADGDFNLDGVVDIFDLAILANAYGYPGGQAVPEPAGVTMLLAGLAGLLRPRRRGRSRRVRPAGHSCRIV